ncbi:MAG: hypothetical protein OEZ52_16780 [Candidatus Aminicenantes bacterium]|nr:hypothetical protein [Candidatus Aminicenantes bacterium]
MHLPSIPREKKEELLKALQRPEGTFIFTAKYVGIFEKAKGKGLLIDLASGNRIIRLERDESLDVNFYYSSPGTGTRVATVNISELEGNTKLWFGLTWSPQEINLYIGGVEVKTGLLRGIGKKSDFELRVGKNGSIYQIGDKGVKVLGARVRIGGELVLGLTAIESWNETLEAIQILKTGKSPKGYVFEAIVANMIIVILSTGFEVYCKKRFCELIGEGIIPNYDELEKKFLSNQEIEVGLNEIFKKEAKEKGVSFAELLVEKRRIDFGNWDHCKNSYNKGYGIRFGIDLGVDNRVLENIQKYINYRHRIVHASPMLTVLNEDDDSPRGPEFAPKIIESAIEEFIELIGKIHEATLKLRPKN